MLHRLRRPVVLVAALCVAALLAFGLAWSAASNAASRGPVADAWQRAQEAGSYHFSSDVLQATVPLAQATNAGRSGRTEQVHLEGATDLNAASLDMQLWSNGGSVLQEGSAVAVRVENGKTYLRQGAGAWQEAPGSNVGRIAPQGDFMAYLQAVRDVVPHPPEERAGVRFTRYSFTLDGPAFAEYIRSQLEQAVRAGGALPANARVEAPSLYRNMSGTGELWVGADGLPLRQILNLSFPAQQDSFQSAQITVNFSQYGRPEAAAFVGVLRDLAARLPDPVATLATLALALVALSVLRFHRSRRLGRAVSAVAIASLALGSLPHALKTEAIATARAAEASAQESARADAATARELGQRLGAPAFDPHENPLAAAERRASAQAMQLGAVAASGGFRAAPASTSPAADTGLDTDNDGLTDWREQRLGTDPTNADTDGDQVPDRIEAAGFTFRNTTGWFLNPSSADSNGDGIIDGAECWRTRPATDPKTMPGCDLDTDNDGMPDVFDDDNDGDGAPDRLDLAPFSAVTGLGDANPLKLTLRNLEAGKPTFVDFQLRPKNAQHLWFAFNVLDWPLDDAGQVRDIDGKTFADVAAANQRPATNDALGDMKLVPMLELRIPNGANLPPQSDLSRYGIGARELGGGVQIAYVPLTVQTDEKTGSRVGFTGRMLYLPGASWPAPNDVRLVWNIQTLLDIPCDPKAANAAQQGCQADGYVHNAPQVIQSYYDDFALTGMSVQQDYGASTAIVYEDPAADDNKRDDTALWALSYGLNTTFVTGRDADKNGQRDISVNEIARRFDRTANGGVSEEQRWAVPNVLRVEKADYATLDQAAITTAMTETKRILNARFAGDASLKPLLLYATESRSRSLGLDALRTAGGYVATSGGSVTVDWQPAGQPRVSLDVLATMKWAAFCSAGGQSWDACASDAYWNELEARSPASALLPEDDPTDADMALGRVGLMQLYYQSMHEGITRTVQQDNVLVSSIYALPSDPENVSLVRTATKLGPLAVKKIANEAILLCISVKDTNQAFTPRNFVRQFGKVVSAWKNGTVGGIAVGALNILKDFFSGGHLNRLKAIGIVGTVVALVGGLATLGVFYLGGAYEAKITVTVITLALTTYFSVISPLLGAKEWFSVLRAGGRTFDGALGSVLQSSSKILGTTRTASALGTVLSLAATWGFFIYSIVSNNVSAFSPEFNKALAETIATTIYILFTAYLSSTVIGTILVGLVALLDALLTAICELGVDELRKVPGLGGACFTLGTSAIKVLSYLLYNYDVMIDVGASDLVVTGAPQVRLTDLNKGFIASNPLRVSLPITTTIRHKDPDAASGLMINLYLWQFSPDNLRSSTFRYSLSAPDAQEILPNRDEMRAAWRNVVEDHKYAATPMYRGQASTTATLATGIQLTPGLNRKAEFNLNLGYAVPAYECWVLPHPLVVFSVPPIPVCYTRSHQGTNSTKIDALQYDIFPNTLDEFMQTDIKLGTPALAWDQAFPALRDLDGDGLLARSASGVDPNDNTPDTDNDGLSDAFEVARGAAGVRFSPLLCDTDGDKLADSQEALLGTNPAVRDTDGDGIGDGDEVLHVAYNLSTCRPTSALAGGWPVNIGGVGSPLIVTVSSDPLQADSDNDGLSDGAERNLAYGDAANRVDVNGYPYHPLVANKAPIGIFPSVDDADRFVRPGQKLLYTTTVVRGIPLAPGFLDVLPPPVLGAAPAPYPLNFTAQQTITQQTAFTVQAGAATQAAPITSRVRTGLPNNGGAITTSGGLTVVVDNDKPTTAVTSLSNGQFVPAYKGAVSRALVVGGTASDPTSSISKVEVAGNLGISQAEGTANWSQTIGVLEGPNTIQARATDAVGNEGDLSVPITVYGDATPPDFTYSRPAGAVAATRTATGQWSVRLSGTAEDPKYFGSPGSGVASVEAELVGAGTQGGWQKAILTGTGWTLDYRFPADVGDKSPTGTYDVIVRATDNVGNVSYQVLYQRALLIDSAPPQALLTTTDTSTGALTTTIASALTLGGVITETGVAGLDGLEASFAPLTQVVPFSDTLLKLDFEERAGDRYFADSSGQFNNAGCPGSASARCPALVAGRNGQGIAFDRNGTGLLSVNASPALNFPSDTIPPRSFSVAGWIKLGAESSGGFTIARLNGGYGGYSLGIADGRGLASWTLQTYRGNSIQVNGAADLRDSRWHYLVGTFDRAGQIARLYVDGALVGSTPASNESYGDYVRSKTGLAIGTAGRAATLDQVAVFGRALSPAEIAAIIASADRTWYPTTLTQRGAGVANARWSLPLPAGLEGEYQLDLRGADVLGNRRLGGNAWRGVIDVAAPRVTFTGKATGQSYLDPATGARRYEVVYTCVAEDGYLAEKSFACPGNATQPPVHTYNTDPIRKQLFPDSSQLVKLANTYSVWQESAQPTGSATACDLFKHCTTAAAQAAPATLAAADAAAGDEVELNAAIKRPSAVIITPSDHAFVAATGQETVTVDAEAEGGLKAIELALDGAVVATLPFARAEGVTVAQHTFLVAVGAAGTHTLAARAIAWNGPDQKKPATVQFTLDTQAPTVTLSNTVETVGDTYALGSGVLRFRGAASDDAELDAVQVRVDNGHFADAEFAGGEWHIAYPVPNPEGKTLRVTVRAIDRAGRVSEINRDVPVAISEANPPDTAVTAAPASPANDITATLAFTGTAGEHEVAGYACQLDEGNFAPCTSPQTYADLSKGEHTFRVRAIDSAGFVDPSPAAVTWTVQPGQPDATITGKPASPSAIRAASFTFAGDASAASFECALDGGAWAPCTSPQAYTGLADGRHTFRVRAKDAAGTTGRADRFVWEVTDAAPVAASQSLTTTMGLPLAVTLGASDEDAVRFHLVRQPLHGILLGTAPNLVYEPDTGFVGSDSFSFSADDGDMYSNEATISITVGPKAQDSYGLGSFVALAQEEMTIKANGQVLSGSVAANAAGGSVRVGEDVAFRSADSHVLGDTVEIKEGATVYNPGYNQISGAGTVLGTRATPLALPVVAALPALPAITPGTQAVEVKEGESLTLPAGSYAALTVRERGTLILTGGVYHFAAWRVGERAQVRFAAPSEVRIAGELALSSGIYLGPADGSGASAKDIVIFVGGEAAEGASASVSEEGQAQRASAGGRTAIAANIVAPNSTLRLYEHTDVTGAFFARRILIGADVTLRLDSAFTNGADGRATPLSPQPAAADGTAAEYRVYVPLVVQ